MPTHTLAGGGRFLVSALAPADLFEGDLKYSVDFRSVYAAVLENWLKARSEPILGRKFEPLGIV